MQTFEGELTNVAYLFEEDGTTLRAVARDDVGVSLPDSDNGWRLVRVLQLGSEHARTLGIELEAVLHGIHIEGHHIWDSGLANAPIISFPSSRIRR